MNVLVADDHPMIVDGYIQALLAGSFQTHDPFFFKAHNCKDAYAVLLNAISTKELLDIAILDMTIPRYVEMSILSGIDLAVLIHQKMPTCKIIMITAHMEVVIIYDIVKRVRPDGLIIKNDITPGKFRRAINSILLGNQYQSPTVKSCIIEIWKRELMVDDYNRQILMYLSKGYKIKELEGIICLTASAIQKRITKMKKKLWCN